MLSEKHTNFRCNNFFYVISGDLTSVSQTDAESCADPRICLVGCLADDPVALEAAKVCIVSYVVSYFTVCFVFMACFSYYFGTRGLYFIMISIIYSL